MVRRTPIVDPNFVNNVAYSASLMSRFSGYYIGSSDNASYPPIVYVISVHPDAIFVTAEKDIYSPTPYNEWSVQSTLEFLRDNYLGDKYPFFSVPDVLKKMQDDYDDRYNEIVVLGNQLARDLSSGHARKSASQPLGLAFEDKDLENMMRYIKEEASPEESQKMEKALRAMIDSGLPLLLVNVIDRMSIGLDKLAQDFYGKLQSGEYADVFIKDLIRIGALESNWATSEAKTPLAQNLRNIQMKVLEFLGALQAGHAGPNAGEEFYQNANAYVKAIHSAYAMAHKKHLLSNKEFAAVSKRLKGLKKTINDFMSSQKITTHKGKALVPRKSLQNIMYRS